MGETDPLNSPRHVDCSEKNIYNEIVACYILEKYGKSFSYLRFVVTIYVTTTVRQLHHLIIVSSIIKLRQCKSKGARKKSLKSLREREGAAPQ